MKNPTVLFFTLLFSSFVNTSAQQFIEPCKFGQPLIDALQVGFTPSNYLGYGPARDVLYRDIDAVQNELFCVYTNFSVQLDPNADPSQSAYQNGAGLNAEHIYPQAKGAGSEPERGDMHNIYPCKVNVNGDRGNCVYAEIEDNDTDRWYYLGNSQTNIPTQNIDLYSERDVEDCRFEPRESMKGDIARTVFYFYAIYQNTADREDAAFFPAQKDVLLQWHYQDLPDAVERRRDSLIGVRQGNCNPFVLDSSLARRAFFMPDANYMEGDSNCLNASVEDLFEYHGFRLESVHTREAWVLYADRVGGKLSLFEFNGRPLRTEEIRRETRLSAAALPSGYYLLKIEWGEHEKWIKVVKE